jgi:hypothetical protein
MTKGLVLYYSAYGHVAGVAEITAALVQGRRAQTA